MLNSCTNENEKQVNKIEKQIEPQAKIDNNSKAKIEMPLSSNTIEDTIRYDTLEFPLIELSNDAKKNNNYFPGKILTTGHFHNEEVWPNAENENWFGIFRNKNGYYISQTKITVNREHDGIVDAENSEVETGWEIKTENKDTSILLVSGLNHIQNHRINEIKLKDKIIFPGDSIKIEYKGNLYNIYATGIKFQPYESSNDYAICNYKLFLKAKINGVEKSQLLVSSPRNDDALANILFIGDIDGDGLLDIIIDTTNHYNVERPTLYLSNPGDNEVLLKIVGIHVTYGC